MGTVAEESDAIVSAQASEPKTHSSTQVVADVGALPPQCPESPVQILGATHQGIDAADRVHNAGLMVLPTL